MRCDAARAIDAMWRRMARFAAVLRAAAQTTLAARFFTRGPSTRRPCAESRSWRRRHSAYGGQQTLRSVGSSGCVTAVVAIRQKAVPRMATTLDEASTRELRDALRDARQAWPAAPPTRPDPRCARILAAVAAARRDIRSRATSAVISSRSRRPGRVGREPDCLRWQSRKSLSATPPRPRAGSSEDGRTSDDNCRGRGTAAAASWIVRGRVRGQLSGTRRGTAAAASRIV